MESTTQAIDVYLHEEPMLLNFIPIRFETTEPLAFLKRSSQEEEEQQQQQQRDGSDMKSVPHLNTKLITSNLRKSIG